ncbi:lipopolysaccharide biosynthesis protein [Pseudomonas sp. NPDC089554]|uniref:lipopolysaccharide biosynthesis protein n=1 Tax=Pseudomonas sp. NPDC089554 TaxID=3390653 RepID=UPI003CFF5EF6
MGGFGRSAVIYFVSNIANAMVPFALLPILTRALGPEEYGFVAVFTILCACATAVISLGVGAAFTRQYYHLDQAGFAVFAGTSICVIVLLTVLGTVLSIPLGAFFKERLPLPASWISCAIASAGALAICNAWLACAQVKSRALQYGVFQVSMTLLNVAASLILVLLLELQGVGRVLGQLLAFIAFAVVAVFSMWRSGWLVFIFDGASFRWLVAFGLPIIPHSISGVVISMSDRLVLGHLKGAAVVGVYAVAAQLSMIMALMVDSLNKAYVPWLYSRLALDQESVRRKLVRLSYVYFVGVLVLATVLSAVVPEFVVFIAGEDYAAATGYLPWLFFSGAFTGMYYMVGLYINYAAQNKYLSYASTAAALLTPVACYLLIERHGAVGAAQGALVGQIVLFVITWFCSMRAYTMPWFTR